MRLLSDAAFCEEFDIVVDEISIRYVAGGFSGDEKDRVERYFLRAPERQEKVRVICELLQQSKVARGEQQVRSETLATITSERPVAIAGGPGLLAGVRSFWTAEPLMFRFAATLIAIVFIIGVVFVLRPGEPISPTYATLTLTSSDAERGQQPAANDVNAVKLARGVDELRLQLLLPSPPPQAASYRAELIPSSTSRNVTTVSQDANSVVIRIPAADLKPDHYAIRLFAVYADGREERIPGSYVFRVE